MLREPVSVKTLTQKMAGTKELIEARINAETAAARIIENINRKSALRLREDLDEEFRKIKSGISDSIATALFEGGKAGSKNSAMYW